jgi:hypothetical protein
MLRRKTIGISGWQPMTKPKIFLGMGIERPKGFRCSACGLYFLNRRLGLDALLKGCPGCLARGQGTVGSIIREPFGRAI